MKKIRWIGVILVIVLLVLSVGSIFAQETTIKPVIGEKSLKEFLENNIECMIGIDYLFFDSTWTHYEIWSDYELKSVPKGFTLYQDVLGDYAVKVTLEKGMELKVLVKKDLIGMVADVRIDVYFYKHFGTLKEAREYIAILLVAMENEKEISIKADSFYVGGERTYRKKNYLRCLRLRWDESKIYTPFWLEVVFE